MRDKVKWDRIRERENERQGEMEIEKSKKNKKRGREAENDRKGEETTRELRAGGRVRARKCEGTRERGRAPGAGGRDHRARVGRSGAAAVGLRRTGRPGRPSAGASWSPSRAAYLLLLEAWWRWSGVPGPRASRRLSGLPPEARAAASSHRAAGAASGGAARGPARPAGARRCQLWAAAGARGVLRQRGALTLRRPPPLGPRPRQWRTRPRAPGGAGLAGGGHCRGPHSHFLLARPHPRRCELTETSHTGDCHQGWFSCKSHAFLAPGLPAGSRSQTCTVLPKRSRNLGPGVGSQPLKTPYSHPLKYEPPLGPMEASWLWCRRFFTIFSSSQQELNSSCFPVGLGSISSKTSRLIIHCIPWLKSVSQSLRPSVPPSLSPSLPLSLSQARYYVKLFTQGIRPNPCLSLVR